MNPMNFSAFEKLNESKKNFPPDYRSLIKEMPKELYNILMSNWEAKQNPKYHWEGNSLKHIIIVLKRSYEKFFDDPDLIMSALFHDLGKMETYKINPKTGQPSAYGHEKVSAELVKKYSAWIDSYENTNSERIYDIVNNHMRIKYAKEMTAKKAEEFQNHIHYNDFLKFNSIDKGGH